MSVGKVAYKFEATLVFDGTPDLLAEHMTDCLGRVIDLLQENGIPVGDFSMSVTTERSHGFELTKELL